MRHLQQNEIDDVLRRNGLGVLALITDGRPYSIPMSIGYDVEWEVITMQWGNGYHGEKGQAFESNPEACLTVYEQNPDDELIWRSVLVRGELFEIKEANHERAYASLVANAEFALDFSVWGIPFDEVEFELLGLRTKECTGREFGASHA